MAGLQATLWCVVVTGVLIGCGDRPSAGTLIEQQLKATDWHTRHRLASELATDHSQRSFEALLQLLNDSHPDVSYAAAEALEARSDNNYAHDLAKAIPQLPRERRWPVYRALRNYPSVETLRFLANALSEELEHHRGSQTFEDRNCHYIAKSIEELAGKVSALGVAIKAPVEGSWQDFAHLLAQAKSALAKMPSTPPPK